MMTLFEYGDSGVWPIRGHFYYFFKPKIDLKLVSKSAPDSFTIIAGGLSKISFLGIGIHTGGRLEFPCVRCRSENFKTY
jgi:hypothetical protein